MIEILKIDNLFSLVTMAEKNNNSIQKGTFFLYDGDLYNVVDFDSTIHTCSEFCDLEGIFDKELIKNNIGTSCGEHCPFNWNNLAIKLSEIEKMILLGDNKK